MSYKTLKHIHKKINPYMIKCFKNYKVIIASFSLLVLISICIESSITFWYKIFYNSLEQKKIGKLFKIIPIYISLSSLNHMIQSSIFVYKHRIIYKISEIMYQANYHLIKNNKYETSNQRIIDDLTEISDFYFKSIETIIISLMKVIIFSIIISLNIKYGFIFAIISFTVPILAKYILDPLSKPLSKIVYIQEEIIAKLKNKIYKKKELDLSKSFSKISKISNMLKFKESILSFTSNFFKTILDLISYIIYIPYFIYNDNFFIGNFMQSTSLSRKILFATMDIISIRQGSFRNQGILRRIQEMTDSYIKK